MNRATCTPRRFSVATALLAMAMSACAAPLPVNDLNAGDRQGIASASQQALETIRTGESVNWANSQTGNRGSVTPTRTFEAYSGTPCRDFRHTAFAGGRTLVAHDTACRGDDGLWHSANYSSVVASLDAPPPYAKPYPARYDPPYYPGYYPLFTSVRFGYWSRRGHGRGYRGRRSGFRFGYGMHY